MCYSTPMTSYTHYYRCRASLQQNEYSDYCDFAVYCFSGLPECR